MKQHFLPVLIMAFFVWAAQIEGATEATPREKEQWRVEGKMSEMIRRLDARDLSLVEEAYVQKDLPVLWAYTDIATTMSMWVKKHQDSDPHAHEFAAKFRDLLYQRLTSIPGYAKWVGDEIENTSNKWSLEYVRERCFMYLGNFPTPEGIHEIGRFLYDERRPGWRDDIPHEVWFQRGGPLPRSNDRMAIQAMDEALGEKSPWQPLKDKNGFVNKDEQVIQLMQDWWRSEASLPFRKGSPYPLPPPKLKTDVATVAELIPPVSRSSPHWGWLVFLALLVAGCGLALWLAAQNKRRV